MEKSESKKKLLIVVPSLKAGGMERVASLLANYFASETLVEVHFITLLPGAHFYDLHPEINCHESASLGNGYFVGQAIEAIRSLRYLLKKIEPDATLSFGDRYNALVVAASLGLNTKVFVSNRQNPYLSNGRFIDLINWLFYRFSAGMIAQTELARDIFREKYRISNILTIGNPFSLPGRSPMDRKPTILNVGRFADAKNQYELIEIYESLQDQHKWELVFVGDGHKKQRTIDRLEQSKAKSRIHIKGFTKAIQGYYQEASVFAFTSRSEGFPNALGEAMAHGCACISYDCVAGPADLIDNGVNGFLIPEGDKEMYIKKLQELIDNDSLRQEMGRAAVDKMSSFSLEIIANNYLKFMFKSL